MMAPLLAAFVFWRGQTAPSGYSPLVKSVLEDTSPIPEDHQQHMKAIFEYTEWIQTPLKDMLALESSVDAAYISQSFAPGKGQSVLVYLRSNTDLTEIIKKAEAIAASKPLDGAVVEFISVGSEHPMVDRLNDRMPFFRKNGGG